MGVRFKIRQNFPYILILLTIIFLLKKKKTQERHYELFISNASPEKVWGYLADFRNVVKLNKRIEHWEIVGEESRTIHKWSYHVLTHESMIGQLVFGSNVNLGKIDVITSNGPHNYKINGDYTTASFRGLIVVDNWSRMEMSEWKQGTKTGTLYKEIVGMTCPLLFSYLCGIETDQNRGDFLQHLKQAFL